MSLGAMTPKFNPKGASSAIIAACLFGLSAPASKLLLDKISPIFLAGLLYLGAGLGLLAYRFFSRSRYSRRHCFSYISTTRHF
jgi:drug/metabolite transporter (DMT)-like permease